MMGRNRLLALLLAAVLWHPTVAAQETDPETLRLLLDRAETMLQSGNSDAGLDALERLLTRAEGVTAGSPEPLRLVVERALVVRTLARWDAQQRDGIDADLDRLIELDPAYLLGTVSNDEGLLARFNRRRERLVGFLRVGISPADAQIVLNGTPLTDVEEIIPVLAGDHRVGAQRRGFAPQEEVVSVRANRTEGVGLSLERSSATIQVATTPPGARVVLDGEAVGFTTGPADADTSAPLVVEGLLPGWHEIEITLANHRPFRQRIEVPTLMDYDLGVLAMSLALGTVTLRAVPPNAEVWVDGTQVAVARASDDSIRLQLPVGDHALLLGADGGRVWSDTVLVADGGSLARDVHLAPGLAFLGVAGGDALDRQSTTEPLLRGLATLDGWVVLDRSAFAAEVSSTEALHLADGSQEELRCRFEDETPAGLFAIGAFAPDDPGVVQLNIWAAGSPLPPVQVAVPLGDPESMRSALSALAEHLPAARPWHGIVLFNGPLGPIVGAVSPTSPAAVAGIVAGDLIASIDGAAATTASAFDQMLAAGSPQRSIEVGIQRGAQAQTLRLNLEASPNIDSAPSPAAALAWWAQAGAAMAAGSGQQPSWALHLQQALLLIDRGQIDAAAEMLWDAAAPIGSSFGQAAVDYWLGVALSMGSTPDFSAARNALNRAASVEGARLFHNDGPLIGPRARARIARIAARDQ